MITPKARFFLASNREFAGNISQVVHFGLVNENILLRQAAADDLEAINDIYNHYVLHSTCTYQEEPETIEARQQWFDDHRPEQHPAIVAVLNGKIVGWGSVSAYHSRCAYRHTAEISIYVQHEHHRRGIGSAILDDLMARARNIGYHAVIAAIDGDQKASITMHIRFGFIEVGHFQQVGFKFGRWLDVIYLEWILQTP